MKLVTNPISKKFLAFLPLLVSISILANFFTHHPNTSLDLLDQSLKRIGLIRLSSLPTDPVPPVNVSSITATPTPAETKKPTPTPSPISYYTGAELWQEVQQYRREHGIPEFKQDNVLCTITSIRVNQLLTLNALDDHNGFSPSIERFRENGQLTHNNVAENILSGYPTATEAIKGWDSSLGHQSLMLDGSYVYACVSANSGFAVLVAAY
jgi:uncharacterized protein YkwD